MSEYIYKKILTPFQYLTQYGQTTEETDETIDDTTQEISMPSQIITHPDTDYNILTELSRYKKSTSGFKIIILGDVAVGKTSIYNSLLGRHNPSLTTTTYRPDTSLIHYDDIILSINDTVGQEAFKSICQNYYREPQIVLFVFDINRMETFMHIPEWQNEVIYRNKENIPIKYYLIANKRDLNPTKSLEGATKYAAENNMTLVVTSVKRPETIKILSR